MSHVSIVSGRKYVAIQNSAVLFPQLKRSGSHKDERFIFQALPNMMAASKIPMTITRVAGNTTHQIIMNPIHHIFPIVLLLRA
jgi:hypothetical protein